jgi:hypothetical protein
VREDGNGEVARWWRPFGKRLGEAHRCRSNARTGHVEMRLSPLSMSVRSSSAVSSWPGSTR